MNKEKEKFVSPSDNQTMMVPECESPIASVESLSHIVSAALDARHLLDSVIVTQNRQHHPLHCILPIHKQHDSRNLDSSSLFPRSRIVMTREHIQSLCSVYQKCEEKEEIEFYHQHLLVEIQNILFRTAQSSLLALNNNECIFPCSLLSNFSITRSPPDIKKENIMELLGSQKIHVFINGLVESMGPLAYEAILEEEEEYTEVFDSEINKTVSITMEVGKQEYQKITSKLSKLISNSDLLLQPKQIEELSYQALQHIIKWGYNDGLGEEIVLSSLETFFSSKHQSRRKMMFKKDFRNKQAVTCHVGVRQWNSSYHGVGIAIESDLKFGVYLTNNRLNDNDANYVEEDKFCLASCTLVRTMPLSLKGDKDYNECDDEKFPLVIDGNIFMDTLDKPSNEDFSPDLLDSNNEIYIVIKLSSLQIENKDDHPSIEQNEEDGEVSIEKKNNGSKPVNENITSQTPISVVIKNLDEGRASSSQYTIDSSFEVFAWGHNEFNCLGIPQSTSKECSIQVQPYKLSIPDFPPFDHIVSIVCSSCHTIILTALGCVYSCGDGSDGQLGHGTFESRQCFQQIDWFSAPYEVDRKNNTREGRGTNNPIIIRQIAAGADKFGSHSASIDTYGNLYTWGKGTSCGHVSYNELGESGSSTSTKRKKTMKRGGSYIPFPVKVIAFNDNKVLKVVCGGSFTLAIVQHGKDCIDDIFSQRQKATSVFSWGLHTNGRLGHGQEENIPDLRKNSVQARQKNTPLYQLRPRRIKKFDGKCVSDIAAGQSHALAVTYDGKVYAWGSNHVGQCGIVSVDPTTAKLAAKNRVNARIKGTGIPKSPSVFDDVWIPRLVSPFHGDEKIGDNYRCTLLPSETIMASRVEAGKLHSAVIDLNGRLWTWGGGDKNESCLGHGDLPSVSDEHLDLHSYDLDANQKSKLSGNLKPPIWAIPRLVHALKDKEVVKINFGEIHCASITKCGKVYLWGGGASIIKMTPNEHNHEKLPTKSTSSIEYIPCQPHDEWLQQLVGYNIASLACGGQHTFVIVNGTNIAHSIGRALLRENELFTQKAFKEIDSDDNDELLLNSIYSAPNYSQPDCAIIVSGRRIYCHKFILSSRCPIMHEMIANEERPRPQSDDGFGLTLEIFLSDIRLDVARTLIRFLYTDHLLVCDNTSRDQENTSINPLRSIPPIFFFNDLLKKAKEFGLNRLMKLCKRYIDYYHYINKNRGLVSENDNSHIIMDEENHSSSLRSDIMNNFLSENQSKPSIANKNLSFSIQLIASGKCIEVHPCILSTRSEYFRNLLRSAPFPFKAPIEVPCKFPALIRLVYYLHTGLLLSTRSDDDVEIEVDEHETKHIESYNNVFQDLQEDLRNAHLFQVMDMKHECESRIEVTKENVIQVLELAVEVNSERLKEHVLYILSSQLGDPVIQTQLMNIGFQYKDILSEIFERVKNSEKSRTKGGKSMVVSGNGCGYDLMIPRELQRDFIEVEQRKRLQKRMQQDEITKKMMGSHWFNFDVRFDQNVWKEKGGGTFTFSHYVKWLQSLFMAFLKTNGGKMIMAVSAYFWIQRRVTLGIWIPIINVLFMVLCGHIMISGI